MLFDYTAMAKAGGFAPDDKPVVNHITFNPAGDRFMFLLRSFPRSGWRWSTSLLVSDLQGNMKCLLSNSTYSHYDWETDTRLFGYCRGGEGMEDMYTVDVETGVFTLLPGSVFAGKDIHCLYRADRRYFIGDDYPDAQGYRRIHLFDTKMRKNRILIQSYSPYTIEDVDIRTDLHNRFNTATNEISFDAIHNSKREICEMSLAEFL